jgi:uncharacterized membrane protein YqjE
VNIAPMFRISAGRLRIRVGEGSVHPMKATLRIAFAVMAVLFLSLTTFKIMVLGCLILWLIDVVRGDIAQKLIRNGAILTGEAEPEVAGLSMVNSAT